ncbi:YqiA/YcfP family alpha/beta fold hydrolase [Motiliproteus sp.]|uniref:YqiA/YcfP family alpha/beta fold hydrolase n=1 Tax=Motiliproteus sp. TaxID=1898955 RepID=UPI003BA911BC
MNTPLYLYIHGFNSSPQSYKARHLGNWMKQQGQGKRLLVPELPYQPADAIVLLEELLAEQRRRHQQPIVLLGSSLGGYYATYLVETQGRESNLSAVLINPSVRPFELLDVWLGENENIYTHERYLLTRGHLDQLLTLNRQSLHDPSRYLLLTQTGDEVLDYREGVEKFAQSRQVVTEGGDHGFQHFDSYWPTLFEFANDDALKQQAEAYLKAMTSPADNATNPADN